MQSRVVLSLHCRWTLKPQSTGRVGGAEWKGQSGRGRVGGAEWERQSGRGRGERGERPKTKWNTEVHTDNYIHIYVVWGVPTLFSTRIRTYVCWEGGCFRQVIMYVRKGTHYILIGSSILQYTYPHEGSKAYQTSTPSPLNGGGAQCSNTLYSRFRVFSPDCTLHFAITHVIKV